MKARPGFARTIYTTQFSPHKLQISFVFSAVHLKPLCVQCFYSSTYHFLSYQSNRQASPTQPKFDLLAIQRCFHAASEPFFQLPE